MTMYVLYYYVLKLFIYFFYKYFFNLLACSYKKKTKLYDKLI